MVRQNHLSPPIDVRRLLQEHAEVIFRRMPADLDIDAVAVQRPGSARPTVVLNSIRPQSRQRFTLAHELGHVLLPWHLGETAIGCNFIRTDDEGSSGGESFVREVTFLSLEHEANTFASHLLVPRDWLAAYVVPDGLLGPDVFGRLAEAEVSAEAGIIALKDALPKGHILAFLDDYGRVEKAWRSPGTLINEPPPSAPAPTLGFLDELSESTGTVEHRNRSIRWWVFPDVRPLGPVVSGPEAHLRREASAIRERMLRRSHLQDRSQSFAGVVGSANNMASDDPDSLGEALRQRLASRPEFRPVVADEEFGEWLRYQVSLLVLRDTRRRGHR